MGARCSWTGGRGNLARNCARRSCVFSLKVLVDSISGECVPNWANLPIKSSHSRIDLLKSSSIATTPRRWRVRTAALGSSSAPGSLSWPAYVPSGVSGCNENSGGSDYWVRAAAERDNANRQPVFGAWLGAAIFSVGSGREDSLRAPATAREEKYRRPPLASVFTVTLAIEREQKRAQYSANTQQLSLRGAPFTCASLRTQKRCRRESVQRPKALNHHRSSLQPRAHNTRWTPSAAACRRR